MRISDWSSDVCSSDLARHHRADSGTASAADCSAPADLAFTPGKPDGEADGQYNEARSHPASPFNACSDGDPAYRPNSGFRVRRGRSEEHTSELQSLMRISYAVFCLKKKNHTLYQKRPHKIRHHTQ